MTAVRAVLLEVAGDVVASEAFHAHQLQDAGGYGLVDSELLNGLSKAAVELWCPLHLQTTVDKGVAVLNIKNSCIRLNAKKNSASLGMHES